MTGTALITGAARRIGKHMALDLASKGWAVGVHYNTSEEQADEVVSKIKAGGGRAVAVQGDLSNIDAPSQIMARTADALGPVTCLVNNASRFDPDEADTVTPQGWDRHLDTNLRAPVFLSQSFAAQVPDGVDGNIVNIIDQRVWKLNPTFFSYTASKSALWTVTRTLAQSLAPRIRVNAIGPGPALPNARMNEEDFAKQSRLTLLQRGTSPEEISSALSFILSASALTGQMIVLDGGQHLVWQTPDVTDVNE
jgi:NAD(P)-dependent dehydrogenase (short-subunit alcohol dehydrogenase family)